MALKQLHPAVACVVVIAGAVVMCFFIYQLFKTVRKF